MIDKGREAANGIESEEVVYYLHGCIAGEYLADGACVLDI